MDKDRKTRQDTGTKQTEHWQGKLIDHNGRIGTIELTLDATGKSSWTVRVTDRDGHAAELKGESETTYNEQTGLRMKATQEIGQGQTVTWETDLRPSEAGSYAEKALSGRYTLSDGGGRNPLTGGVMILWKFK